MAHFVIDLPTSSASVLFATRLAACLTSPLIITFRGEIGAGKTTLIRAMLRALGVTSAIKSPTFSLVESYQTARFDVHHFDLYRISDESELEYIGFRDYFSGDAVCCIEWPERVSSGIGKVDVEFSLKIKGNGREAQGHALSDKGVTILTKLY